MVCGHGTVKPCFVYLSVCSFIYLTLHPIGFKDHNLSVKGDSVSLLLSSSNLRLFCVISVVVPITTLVRLRKGSAVTDVV